MKQGAKCPKCGGTFTKLKDYACPLCGEALILKRIKEGQTTKNVYALKNVEVKVELPPLPENKWVFGTVKAYQEGEGWGVYVGVLLPYLTCPECKKKAFFSPTMREGSLSHKCDRCKTVTVYHFKV